jgi:hypothetical protein
VGPIAGLDAVVRNEVVNLVSLNITQSGKLLRNIYIFCFIFRRYLVRIPAETGYIVYRDFKSLKMNAIRSHHPPPSLN